MADVYDLAEQFRQRVIRRERDTASRLVREYGRVYQRIQDEVRQLLASADAARQRGDIVDAAWVYQYDRLRRLQAQTEAQVRQFADAAGMQIEAGQMEGARAGQRDAEALMRAAMGPLPSGVAATFNRLSTSALNELIGFTSDGTPLGKLLAELGPAAARRVGDALIQGLALGKNPKVIAGDVRQALGGNMARALVIARTETLRAYREATRASYAANSDIISGWRWLSARQARTCAACWAMDGRVFELEEPMPAHPNCRCVMLPIIIGGRQSASPATGAEAFAKLSVADQRKVLGADYDAWKAGRVTLDGFVRVRKSLDWGTTVSAGRPAEKVVKLPGSLQRPVDALAFFRNRELTLPDAITPDEAAKRIVEIHNGATASPGSTFNLIFGNLAGLPVFSVSPFTHQTVRLPGPQVEEQDIRDFIVANQSALNKPNAAIGTWYNEEDGITYVDIVIIAEGRKQAEELGVKYNQIGVFGLEQMEFIPTGGTGDASGERLDPDKVIPSWREK